MSGFDRLTGPSSTTSSQPPMVVLRQFQNWIDLILTTDAVGRADSGGKTEPAAFPLPAMLEHWGPCGAVSVPVACSSK